MSKLQAKPEPEPENPEIDPAVLRRILHADPKVVAARMEAARRRPKRTHTPSQRGSRKG